MARQIRGFMQELTPLVEPLSLDEAYLDLSGTERIHHQSPAKTMAALAAVAVSHPIETRMPPPVAGGQARHRSGVRTVE